jgi:sensor histidine kinase regulating citrate/malate metabolism
MLSNQIDNALNANLNIAKTEARYIQISIIKKQNFYLFRVENPFNPLIAVNRANPERHGFGLEIIESIANKYEGTMNIEKNGSLLINTVMLQKVETKK